MSIFVLLKYGEEAGSKQVFFGRGIFSNPLIIACILGLFFNLLGVELPKSLLGMQIF